MVYHCNEITSHHKLPTQTIMILIVHLNIIDAPYYNAIFSIIEPTQNKNQKNRKKMLTSCPPKESQCENMNEEESEREYAIRPNKEELKRDLKALHELGRQLVNLPEAHFTQIPIEGRVKQEILDAKKFKKAALQRQLRFIASLLQEEDAASIREALRLVKLPHKKSVAEFHRLETWRDQLLTEDSAIFEEIVQELSADRQHMRQLIRNANKEAAQNKPPKSSRLLFKYLQALKEA